MRFPHALLILLLALLPQLSCAEAQRAYVIDESFRGADDLGLYLDLFEDPEAELSAAEVIARADEFIPSDKREHGFGTTASVWWARLTLSNRGDAPRRLILQQGYSLIDHFDLWQLESDELHVRRSGDMLPYDSREIAANALAFVIELPPRSEWTLYLRYQTSGSLSINLTLHDPLAYAELRGREQMIQGASYGALLALALYNLFIFFIVRDRGYLLYIAYLGVFSLFISGFHGYTAVLLPPWWSNHLLLVSWGAVIAMALIFSQNFLSLRRYSPRINRIVNGFTAIAVGCAIASLFLPYAAVVELLFLLAPTAYTLILIAAYQGIRRGYAPAYYFMTAWALLMVAAISATLITAGVLRQLPISAPQIIQIGALAEMVLLSIALASRIRNLEKDSLTDPLTAVFNRRFFDMQLPRLLGQSRRHESPLSLMVIDIDHFKQFNDTRGHAEGDTALKRVAALLSTLLRDADYVCRYGGEEFVVLLPDTDGDEARNIAERMRKAIETEGEGEMGITVSIGLACNGRDFTLNEEQLFGAADIALYRAKEQGRNRVEVLEKNSPES